LADGEVSATLALDRSHSVWRATHSPDSLILCHCLGLPLSGLLPSQSYFPTLAPVNLGAKTLRWVESKGHSYIAERMLCHIQKGCEIAGQSSSTPTYPRPPCQSQATGETPARGFKHTSSNPSVKERWRVYKLLAICDPRHHSVNLPNVPSQARNMS
jgi:hypothetical protein